MYSSTIKAFFHCHFIKVQMYLLLLPTKVLQPRLLLVQLQLFSLKFLLLSSWSAFTHPVLLVAAAEAAATASFAFSFTINKKDRHPCDNYIIVFHKMEALIVRYKVRLSMAGRIWEKLPKDWKKPLYFPCRYCWCHCYCENCWWCRCCCCNFWM